MSKLIQKILDIGGCDAETEWGQGYDDGVNAAVNVVEEYFEQPTLNENQQIVLAGLKEITLSYNRQFEIKYGFKYAIRDLYYYLEIDYGCLENKAIVDMCESYGWLANKEFAQVLQEFSQWALEREED